MADCPGHPWRDLATLSRRIDRIGRATDWEATDMAKLLAAAGIDFIDQGGARTVVGLCPEHAAKFEPSLSETYGNRAEMAVWRASPPQLKAHLAPVFDAGHDAFNNWLVVGRCQPVDIDVDVELEDFAYSVSGISDIEPQNLGWYKDTLVVMDYGQRTADPLDFFDEPDYALERLSEAPNSTPREFLPVPVSPDL